MLYPEFCFLVVTTSEIKPTVVGGGVEDEKALWPYDDKLKVRKMQLYIG